MCGKQPPRCYVTDSTDLAVISVPRRAGIGRPCVGKSAKGKAIYYAARRPRGESQPGAAGRGAWPPATVSRGAAGPIPFHAFRRACAFYSWYRLRPTWWAPEKSKDIAACARSFRVRQIAWLIEAPRRSSAIGTEVSAGRHKSDCRSTAGEDQQGLRLCGLEGRRSMQ